MLAATLITVTFGDDVSFVIEEIKVTCKEFKLFNVTVVDMTCYILISEA